MKRQLGLVSLSLILAIVSMINVKAEPKLEDLPLDNYRLYSTVTIDLHDSIKDPGNEYEIRWYANEELVNEIYGLFGNQTITYQYIMADCVGKEIYAVIEAYNTKERVTTEKKILEPASGNVVIAQNDKTVVTDISGFDATDDYDYTWIVGNIQKDNKESIYTINQDDIGKTIYCLVKSKNTTHEVVSNRITLGLKDYSVYTPNKKVGGEWINGLSNRRWYQRKDGTHPVGEKQLDGSIKYTWEEIDGKWFAFNELGYATNGFILDGTDNNIYYTDSIEGLNVGWQEIDGKWYYFSDVHDGFYGKLLKDTTTPDGYEVDENGIWIER